VNDLTFGLGMENEPESMTGQGALFSFFRRLNARVGFPFD
jgi:hypothetical protein